MQRRPYNKKGFEPTLMCANRNCDNISSKLSIVEKKIIDALKKWLENYEVDFNKIKNTFLNEDIESKKAGIQNLIKEKERENRKLINVYTLLEEEVYSREEFLTRSKEIKNKIEEIEEKIIFFQNDLNEKESAKNNEDMIVPKLKNIIDIYSSLDNMEEKNYLLKTVLSKVTYLKTERAIKKDSDPTNFELNIYPKISKI